MEFESFQEGELLHIGIEEGGTAPVDSLLAIIGEKGEDINHMIEVLQPQLPSRYIVETPEPSNSQTEALVSDEEKTVMPEGVEVITMPRLSDTKEEERLQNGMGG